MDSLLIQTKDTLFTVKEIDPDIIFTINDSLHYSKESDFKSEDAKQQYIAYRSLYQKYTKGKKALEGKRALYLQSNPELQKQLSAEILKLESEVFKIQKDLPVMEKRVRNLEIDKLSK